MKFLSVSFDLLVPTRLYEVNSTGKLVLYYDGSKEYFGKEHLPYAILALFVMTFFQHLAHPFISLLSVHVVPETSQLSSSKLGFMFYTCSWTYFKAATKMEHNQEHVTIDGFQPCTSSSGLLFS